MTRNDQLFADCLADALSDQARIRMQSLTNAFMQSVEQSLTEAELAQLARDERADVWAAKTWRV